MKVNQEKIMDTRITLSKVLTVGLAFAMLISLASLAQATAISIATGGFNADEIFENTGSSSVNALVDNGTSTWAETGYIGVTSGLPTSGNFLSATGSGVTYYFQSYSGNNALRIDGTGPGTLNVTSDFYTTLYILATSGNGNSTGLSDITLTFSDLTTNTYPNALYAPDWYDGTQGVSNVALGLRERVNAAGNAIDTDHGAHFQLYESVLNLFSADQAKTLTSITFNDATGGSGVTNVYAVDGIPVPVPATVWLLGSGLVGLGILRRKWSLKK